MKGAPGARRRAVTVSSLRPLLGWAQAGATVTSDSASPSQASSTGMFGQCSSFVGLPTAQAACRKGDLVDRGHDVSDSAGRQKQ